jgi:hypothetical protein
VLAVTSDRDAALPLLKSVSDLPAEYFAAGVHSGKPKRSSAEHPVLRKFPLQPPGGSSGQPVGISKPTTIAALSYPEGAAGTLGMEGYQKLSSRIFMEQENRPPR